MYVYICTHTNTHTHTHIYIYIYIYMHIQRIDPRVFMFFIVVCVHEIRQFCCVFKYTNTEHNSPREPVGEEDPATIAQMVRVNPMHTHTHTHTHIYMYIYTHTHTYIYIYAG